MVWNFVLRLYKLRICSTYYNLYKGCIRGSSLNATIDIFAYKSELVIFVMG